LSAGPGDLSSSADEQTYLAARVAELERALQLRDEFLSIAAHELRDPMHALLLQVSAAVHAARQHPDPALQRRLERVQQIVDRYVKRASLLLDVARLNATRRPLQVENVDFAEVVREVLDSYAAEAEFHRSSLRADIPESLPGRWDRLGIEQIVSNLVSNAIKFGAGAAIDVQLALEVKGSGVVRFLVRDQGIGIAPQDQERIFGRFEQVLAQGPRIGAGLGLWLVRELVELHGGWIGLVSAPGHGATFTVRLPLAAGPNDGIGDGG
jgi:two-component system, OmpR family, sensor kinase